MVSVSLSFLLALIVTLATTPLVRKLAFQIGAVDGRGKDSRRVHSVATPRLGGLAIAAGFYLPLAGLTVVDSEVGRTLMRDATKVWGLFAGGAAIAALGILDDTAGTNAKQKFVVQVAVATALFFLGFRIGTVSIPFGMRFDLGILAFPITVLWIVGIINALNLIDGLDGLAAGVALVASTGTFVAAFLNGNVLMMLFTASLSGSLLGFLVFNYNPARIFMGDTGSMFLGYILAVTSVTTHTKGAATVAFLIPVLVVGLPIMDTFLAIGRRAYRGRPLFAADREHLHHRLLDHGLSQRQAVLILWAMAGLLGVSALLVSRLSGGLAAGVLISAAIAVVLFLKWLGYFGTPPEQLDTDITHADYRELNSHFRERRRELSDALANETEVDSVWGRFRDAANAIEASSLHLWLYYTDPSVVPATHELRGGEDLESPGQHRRRYLLRLGSSHGGMLEVTWDRAHPKLTVDQEYGVRRLVDVFEASLRRVLSEGNPAEVIQLRQRR